MNITDNPLKKGSRFYIGMILTVVEGILSGCNFFVLYEVMKMLWNGTADLLHITKLSLLLACIEALLVPFLRLAFRGVKKHGTEKNSVCAENVSSIVEYVTGIRRMEKGYDTPIGENGNLLSGGERQRLSIARAILKDSPILLLDEATASLDIENELAVKQAIANLLKEKKTVVMIVHTLSIVKNADQILVVSDGKIAESGTHDELLAKNGKYAAMWNAEQKHHCFWCQTEQK